jgi:glycerol-3-phosphate dehydrogenase
MESIFCNRQALFERLRAGDNSYDLVIVGGGITGAGVLREAARSGYRTLLIEQQDFAWGTSSRSSKMIHGGLRYLVSGDLKLTRESLSERERLLREAPGLIERMGYYYVLRKGSFPGRFVMNAVLAVYDFIAGISDHRFIKLPQILEKFPGVKKEGLNGACYYTDAVTDDARLVMRVLQESSSSTTAAINYVRAGDLLLEDDDVVGVQIEDGETGEHFSLKTPVVINATGAWADRLRNQLNSETRIRPLRGSHLIFPAKLLPVSAVLALPHPDDKRAAFIYPWEGTTVIGTTDLDHTDDLDNEASITEQEVRYLMRIVESEFPEASISRSEIISTWAGVRPVIAAEDARDPSKERRDHAVWFDKGLVTVSGGKLTTFRLIALDALAAAAPLLPDANTSTDEQIFSQPTSAVRPLTLMQSRYGTLADQAVSAAQPGEERSIDNTRFSLSDCRWAARSESVMHLDDLLLRRTRLALLLPNGASELFPALEKICSEELGWNSQRWTEEQQRYESIIARYYAVPNTSIDGDAVNAPG